MSLFQSKTASQEAPPLPDELQLQLLPGESRHFTVQVDEECEVLWEISQLNAGPQRVPAGVTRTLTFALPATAPTHAMIRGRLRMVRVGDGAPVRTITVAGWVRKSPAARAPNLGSPVPSPRWWKWALALLVAGLGVGGVFLFPRPPVLEVKPTNINLGTLWYSPPMNGLIDTSIVFTVQWRVAPRAAGTMWLIARQQVHFASDSGSEYLIGQTNEFPLNQDVTEASVPLQCYDLTNEIVKVNGTIELTVSNAPVPVPPAQIQFEAQLKPHPLEP